MLLRAEEWPCGSSSGSERKAEATSRNVLSRPAGQLPQRSEGASAEINKRPELGRRQVALSDWYWVDLQPEGY